MPDKDPAVKRQRERLRRLNFPEYKRAMDKAYREKNKEKVKEVMASYYQRNKEKIKARSKEWFEANKERHKKRSAEYYAKNQEKVRAQAKKYRSRPGMGKIVYQKMKKRAEVDLLYRLRLRMRGRLKKAIAREYRDKTTFEMIGCTVEELKAHLESLFKPGMSWRNYGYRTWHIDHKRPLASFDLTDPVQRAEACHFRNLQPMFWLENIRKSRKAPVPL